MSDVSQAAKVIDVIADAGSCIAKVVADKGGIVAKLAHLMPMTADVVLLAGVDFSALKTQVLALDSAGVQSLLAEFQAKFQLDDKALEAKVEEGLALAIDAEQLVARIVSFSKSLTAPSAVAPAVPSA